MFHTSLTQNIIFCKVGESDSGLLHKSQTGYNWVEFVGGTFLEHIGDMTLEFGNIWFKIGSEVIVMITIYNQMRVKWISQTQEYKWQSDNVSHPIQDTYKCHVQERHTAFHTKYKIYVSFRFRPLFLASTYLFLISILKRIPYACCISSSFRWIHPSIYNEL